MKVLTQGQVHFVVGKTVSRVDITKRDDASAGGPAHDITRICFQDGSRIVFTVVETEPGLGYITEALYIPFPGKRK